LPQRITPTATDWDNYYQSVPVTAKLTRQYTNSVLLHVIRKYAVPAAAGSPLHIVEIGGANSCFLDNILNAVPCRSYDVIDTNQRGLSLLQQRATAQNVIHLHRESVLALQPDPSADLVFSVGLVEHFDPPATRRAILAHFDILRSGGIAVITFPTPTPLYNLARKAIETAGMWKFHDERPLEPAEVRAAIEERAEVLFEKTLWPLILTQHLMVAQKPSLQP